MERKATKRRLRWVSALLVVCMLTTSVSLPVDAAPAWTTTANGTIGHYTGFTTANEKPDGSLEFTYAGDTDQYKPGGRTVGTWNASDGFHLDFTDIEMVDNEKYAITVNFGNTANNQGGQNYDKSGFTLVYTSEGKFYVFKNRASYVPDSQDQLAIKADVEPLTAEGFGLDIKLVNNTSYSITLTNPTTQHVYTYDASNLGLGTYKSLYALFALTTGGTSSNAKTKAGSTFTFKLSEISVYKPDGIATSSENYSFKKTGEDLKVTRSAAGWSFERFAYNTASFSAKDNGVTIDIQDISSTSTKGYSLAVAIGGSGNVWTDTTTGGLMLFYSSDGSYFVTSMPIQQSGAQLTSPVLAYGKETFSGKLNLNIQKVKGTQNYIFNINGKEHTVDGSAISGSEKLYFSMGVMNKFNLDAETGVVTNLTHLAEKFIDGPVEFTIKNMKPIEQGKDVGTVTPPSDITFNGQNFRFKELKDNKLMVTRLSSGYAYERFAYKKPYLASGDGVTFNIEDIESDSTSGYSLVVGIGKATNTVWTDKTGIMLFYGSDGSVAIIELPVAVDKNDIVTSKMLAYGKTDFTGKLELTVKQDESQDNYIIIINGTPFEVSGTSIAGSDSINFTMGVMNGYTLNAGTGVMSHLLFWQDNFITADVSFTIASIDGTVDDGVEVLPPDTAKAPDYIKVTGGDTHFLFEEKDKDLLVTSKKETAAWERFVYNKSWLLTGEGTTVKIDDINSRDKNYSLALFIGGTKAGWYDQKGVMVLYSKNGNLAIVATDGLKNEKGGIATALDKAPILASEKITWSKSVTMTLKQLKDDSYVLTFNGKDYPFASECLSGSDEMYLSVGCMNAFTLNEDGTIAGLDFSGAHRTKKLTFTMKEIDGVVPVDESTLDVGTTTLPGYLGVNGEDFRFKQTEEGLQVTHLAAGSAFGRVYYRHGFYSDDGIEVNVDNITSRSRQYSIVVSIAANNAKWYNQKCLMVVYDRSGNLALLAPDGVPTANGGVADLNNAEVLASTKLSPFVDSLKIEVKRVDGTFSITINGMECTVDGKYLDDVDILAFAYGVMSNYTLSNGDVSDLKYWQSKFKTKNVSFILPEIKGKSAADDPIVGTPEEPDALGFVRAGTGIQLYQEQGGLKVVHTAEAASWERLVYKDKFSVERTGLRLVLDEITTKAKNYSLVVKVGAGGWYDSRGYEIHYGRNGQFYIFATDGTIANPNTSPIMVAEKREALGTKFTMSVVLDGTNYKITINGKTYKVPAQYKEYPLPNARQVTLGFGFMNEAEVGKINHAGTFKSNYISFKIKETGGKIAAADMGDPYGLIVHGNYWGLSKNAKGMRISLGTGGTASDYVSVKDSLSTKKGGIQLDLADIKSSDSNYAMAVLVSDTEDPWSDSTGYMIVYGKSGNFSIIATDSQTVTANGAKEVVSEVREELGDNLSVDVRLSGKNYKITVNDKEYTVLAKDKTYPIQDRDNLYVSMGMLSDNKTGEFVTDTVFRKSDLSFTLDSISHSDEEVKEDAVKPEDDVKDKTDVDNEDNVPTVDEPEKENPWKVPITIAAIVVVAVAISGTAVIVLKKKGKKE